jgi:hypothetical protein
MARTGWSCNGEAGSGDDRDDSAEDDPRAETMRHGVDRAS